MMSRSRKRGFTILELLVAATLFISLTAMAAYWIVSGLRAQEFDKSVRDAQTVCRDVLTRLTAEMRTATTLPVVSVVGTGQMPSGVLYPDPYGTVTSSFGGIYTLGSTEADGHFADNRVIFARPATTTAGGYFDPSDLNSYVYVEWMIPENPEHPGTPWNRIYRRVHTVGTSTAGHGQVSGGHWGIVASYFINGTGLKGSKEDSWLVARLDGPEDLIQFRVQHPAFIDSLTGQPGKEVGLLECTACSHPTYDRNLFNVTVRTTAFRRGENSRMANANKSETAMSSQVRIQSGN